MREPHRVRMAPWIAKVPVLLLALFPAVLGASTMETIGGVLHVRNSAEPASGTRRLELKELWRAGGDDGEVFFGVIATAVTDPQGNLYLLDRQLCRIFVYSPEGTLLRTLGREGEGPGEFRGPTDMCWMPGNELGVVHRAPGLVTLIDSDGIPQGILRLLTADGRASSASMRALLCRNGVLAAVGQEHIMEGERYEQRRFLAFYDFQGAEQQRLIVGASGFDYETRTYVERDDYFIDQGGWTLGMDGLLYAAPDRDRYRIDVYRADGTLERVIEREYKPRRRTAAEKTAAANVSMWIHGEPVKVEATVEDTDPCIARVVCLPPGNIWVLHGMSVHDLPPGIFSRYDVFNPAGEYLECVEIACPGDARRDRLIPLENGGFVLLRGIVGAIDAMFSVADPVAADEEPMPLEVIYFAPAE